MSPFCSVFSRPDARIKSALTCEASAILSLATSDMAVRRFSAGSEALPIRPLSTTVSSFVRGRLCTQRRWVSSIPRRENRWISIRNGRRTLQVSSGSGADSSREPRRNWKIEGAKIQQGRDKTVKFKPEEFNKAVIKPEDRKNIIY